MTKRKLLLGVIVLALIGGVVLLRGLWPTDGIAARAPTARATPPGPVQTAMDERKNVPVSLQTLRTVTPIASVAIKARVDTTITAVHFTDGALVHEANPLFTLDDRAIRAQIAQIEGQLA